MQGFFLQNFHEILWTPLFQPPLQALCSGSSGAELSLVLQIITRRNILHAESTNKYNYWLLYNDNVSGAVQRGENEEEDFARVAAAHIDTKRK